MQNIKNKFKEIYPELSFPEGQVRGTVESENLSVRYCFGEDENGVPYLDIYSSNKMGSMHLRIKHNGETEALDTYQEGFSYDPDIPGDEERAQKEHRVHNERVGKMLLDKFY
jgi:ABC-type sulfate transport system substrate-binding protein